MNVNRDNYEEFFVLYIDNELNAAERSAVELFLIENPDLKTELEMLQQAILPMDEPVSFLNKEMLFRTAADDASADTNLRSKQPASVVNEANCEEYFVLYGDNELSNNDNALVEEFVYRHPEYQEHFELIQQVKFQPERNIVFPDRSLLYRSERDSRVVPLFPRMRTWKMAAAAAVMLMVGTGAWYALKTGANDGISAGIASTNTAKPANTGKTDTTNSDEQSNIGSNNGGQLNTGRNGDNQPNSVSNGDAQPNTGSNSAGSPESSANLAAKSGSNNAGDKNTGAVAKHHEDFADVTPQPKNNNFPEKRNAVKSSVGLPEKATVPLIAEAGTKKVTNPSNISDGIAVTQERNKVKIENEKAKVPVVEKKVSDELMASVDNTTTTTDTEVAIGPVKLPENNVFARMANDNDQEFETSDKKNRARGFFRKVSRVFDKATSKEPSENRKGLHIASFAINLK
ncbi:MAG: hypothetical protein EOP51_14185 [Sphingobacteriales bacterium]|nr:MAG: hypothetical protein EOP51_14185 [Sphingobacteriales bacterium]